MSISVNEELQDFRNRLKKQGIDILGFEKVGNGNMSAYKMRYRFSTDHDELIREDFFWRHDMDKFEQKLLHKNNILKE